MYNTNKKGCVMAWIKFIPKSPIMRKWLKEEELPKNIKALTIKAIEKWGMNKNFHNWPHELQMTFVVLIKAYEKEAINMIPTKKTAKDIGKFFLENKNLIFWTKNMSEKKKKFFNEAIEIDIEVLKYILPASEKTLKEAKNTRALRFLNKNSKIAIFAANYKKRKNFKLTKEEELWKEHKRFNGYRIKGEYKDIVYEVCETPEIMFLDDASDCCQGFEKKGEICMIHGVKNKNEGFLVFRDKKTNLIFAQAWIRSIGNGILVYDSVEFKGEFRESLGEAVYESIKKFKKRYNVVAVGVSPNREELNKFLFRKKNKKISPQKEVDIRILILKYITKKRIYSDAKRTFIF